MRSFEVDSANCYGDVSVFGRFFQLSGIGSQNLKTFFSKHRVESE